MNLFHNLLIIFILLLVRCRVNWWWVYSPDDHDTIVSDKEIESKFLEDQTECMWNEISSCHSVNSDLESDPPFDNKCCKFTSSNLEQCVTIFKGKYYESNLYSIGKNYGDYTFDCDGNGEKKYDISSFNPSSKWEITIKEKYDCIYSKTENECKNNPKSFKQNTKCCWFSNDNHLTYSSCFGLSDLTDLEFNRTTPYLVLATLSRVDGEMDFRCYDKTDKVVKGKYNLDYNITVLGSTQEKLIQDMLSDDPLEVFSEKQNFVKIKSYDKTLTNSFQIWTISPHKNIKKFIVSVKFSYSITDSRIRNLETKTEEKVSLCEVINIDESSDLNITTSTCTFSNNEGYTAEKIEIQPGQDLVGKFDDENKVATPGMSSSDEELKNLNNTVYFKFKDPITNLKTNSFDGEITEDRRNVEFVLYHQKGEDSIENIIGKADFLKESKTVIFTTEPSINFDEGITIIPNQLVKSEDGKYLYLKNQMTKGDDDDNDENFNDIRKSDSSWLSTGAIFLMFLFNALYYL